MKLTLNRLIKFVILVLFVLVPFRIINYDYEVVTIPLKNIMDDEAVLNVSSQSQIFFVDTHLDRKRKIKSSRQACSVESAGNMMIN